MGRKNLITILTISVSFLPGIMIILYNFFTDIEGPNPFIILSASIGGAAFVIICLIIFIILEQNLLKKLILPGTVILFQLSIFPLIELTNEIKVKNYLLEHSGQLELAATNLIKGKWTTENAENYCRSNNLQVKLIEHIKETDIVLFHTGGITDNCFGIAYSKSENRAESSICGKVARWDKIFNNWYKWGSG